MKLTPCLKCDVAVKPYWLRDGICNGCRNPHLIVTAEKAMLEAITKYRKT